MSSLYGENLQLLIFGESHGAAVGMTLQGIPAGKRIDPEKLRAFLSRRAPGRNPLTTGRKETDAPEFLSGLRDGRTCGTPVTAVFRNQDARSADYESVRRVPRPGHSDYTAEIKYGGFQAYEGGGHFSGRLTAPLCAAGGIVLQLLEEEGIRVIGRILSVGKVRDLGELGEDLSTREFPVNSPEQAEKMKEAIRNAREKGDSLGAVLECAVLGLPAGLGDPMFDGMENRISRCVFGIPAVKGIEFGDGFGLTGMHGSEANDAFSKTGDRVVTKTNHCGGILGGITDGMPLLFRVAIKPTPSVACPQSTLNLRTGEEEILEIPGRHDPCIGLRALPAVEAAAALAVYDAFLGRKKEL